MEGGCGGGGELRRGVYPKVGGATGDRRLGPAGGGASGCEGEGEGGTWAVPGRPRRQVAPRSYREGKKK